LPSRPSRAVDGVRWVASGCCTGASSAA
jgi:hypothetical protein